MRPTLAQMKSDDFWLTKLTELEAYPGTTTEFCRSQGLNISTFYSKRNKLQSRTPTKTKSRFPVVISKPSPFTPVHVSPLQHRVELPDPEWVAKAFGAGKVCVAKENS